MSLASVTPKPGATILNIQLLRAVAAIGVVYSHTASKAGLSLPLEFGTCGVDIFFVISGFIISHIAHGDPAQFMTKRLIRIVPAYWVATLAMFATAALASAHVHRLSTSSDPVNLICSLFFIPHITAGSTSPTLAAGWTLDFEMYFYLMFALSLALSRRYAAPICIALIIFLLLAFNVSDAVPLAIRDYYGSTMVLEFVFGMLIYLASRGGVFQTRGVRGDALFWVTLIAIAAGFAVLPLSELTGLPRVPYSGPSAAAIVAGTILLEMRYGLASRNWTLLLLGEASYILYLTHTFVIYGFTRVILPGAVHWPDVARWPLALALVALAAAISCALHLWLEKPALSMLRKRFTRRVPAVQAG